MALMSFRLYHGDNFDGVIIHKGQEYKCSGIVNSVHINSYLKILYIVEILKFHSPLNGIIFPSRAVFDDDLKFVGFDLRDVF